MEDFNYSITSEEEFKKNRKLLKKYLVIFAVIFLILGSFWFGYRRGEKAQLQKAEQPISFQEANIINKTPSDKKDLDYSLYWKVWNLLGEKYVDKGALDAKKLLYGSIQGMLNATGDPYSSFFDPKQTQAFSDDLQGSFDGIGAELGIKDDILTVIAPLEGSPAEKSGLRAGDKILKIGDKLSTDFSIDEAVDLIRGKKGTEVKLTVLHKGEQETQEITIVRDTIEVKSVKLEMKPDGIAYVKINQFGENTTNEFNSAANSIVSQNAKGIILDLRNNPGGFLDGSVDIASRLMPKGKVVVTEEDNTGKKDNLYTKGGDKLSSFPLVVLINEGSASASEILAAALRDNQGIQLVGEKSFGKGTVQEYINLPGNSSVKITVAKWITPKGDYIMEKGIDPDVEVKLTLDDFNNNRDPQLDKALEVIKGKI